MIQFLNLEKMRKHIESQTSFEEERFLFPSPIHRTMDFKLIAIAEGEATFEALPNLKLYANPMGTIHGGLIATLADLAIGTAHATMLPEDTSFTTVDLSVKYIRPVWEQRIVAHAFPIHSGKTISHYSCEIKQDDGKLIAQCNSTIMTLRGEKAMGR